MQVQVGRPTEAIISIIISVSAVSTISIISTSITIIIIYTSISICMSISYYE